MSAEESNRISAGGEELNALGYPKLKPTSPVPSDIRISQQIVRDVGLLPVSEVAKQ